MQYSSFLFGPILALTNRFVIFLACIDYKEWTVQVVWQQAANRWPQKWYTNYFSKNPFPLYVLWYFDQLFSHLSHRAMKGTDLALVTGHLEGRIGWHFTLKRKVSPKKKFLRCAAYLLQTIYHCKSLSTPSSWSSQAWKIYIRDNPTVRAEQQLAAIGLRLRHH